MGRELSIVVAIATVVCNVGIQPLRDQVGRIMNEEWIPVNRTDDQSEIDRKEIIYSWIYSPSGRYAVDFDYKEIVQQQEDPETHHFLFRFFVLDVLRKEWCPYTVNTGPFKRFYSFYWLDNSSAVLLDFTKRDSSIRQNVLRFDHENKTITCDLSRIFEFDVDCMCYSKDLTSQKLVHPGGDLLLLCGFRSLEQGLVCRLVPYCPFEQVSSSVDIFRLNVGDIVRNLTLDNSICTGGHPFLYGTTLTFLLYGRNATKLFHFINYTLQIDLRAVLDKRGSISADDARLNTFIFPPNPDWVPIINSIPNLYNTERYVIIWQGPRRSTARSGPRRTKIFILDLKLNIMWLTNSSLHRSDFVCLHPSGALHTFIQSCVGMRMKMTKLNFSVHSLKSLCQQIFIRHSAEYIDVCNNLNSTLSEFTKDLFC